MSDELCISGDTATIALPEYAIQSHYRYSAAGDDLAQHGAGPDRGKLIRIANQHKLTAVRYGAEQMVGKIDIHHGHLIHYNQIRIQHLRFTVVAVLTGQKPKRFVNGSGREPGRLLHPAGCASCRRTADNFCSAVFPAIDIQQESLDQRLAGTGAAGNHTEL